MKKVAMLFIVNLICACATAQAQIVNYVKNPSFEDTLKCPDDINRIIYSKYWSCAVDTDGVPWFAPELYNKCSSLPNVSIPENGCGFQYPHNGNAYIGCHFYYDKTPPPPPGLGASNWRDYAQGHLHQPLQAGKTYCISFWVVLAEISGYVHNNIGAYLDNGNINKRSPAGDMITDVIPQLFTSAIIKDTQNWVKVEGSFVATGNETHITLGNFAKQADIDTESVPYYAFSKQYSYYLIDDVSVIPIDLPADAGKDTWVEITKKVKIGRVGDTTAEGLDCKWYHKGALIDSGAIITVNANSVVNAVDTYVVVQTICGLVKTDTVMVKTTGLGILSQGGLRDGFSIYPNPSNGTLVIANTSLRGTKQSEAIYATIYDLLGRVVHQQNLSFSSKEASLKLNLPNATYILELQDEAGNVQRERIVIE